MRTPNLHADAHETDEALVDDLALPEPWPNWDVEARRHENGPVVGGQVAHAKGNVLLLFRPDTFPRPVDKPRLRAQHAHTLDDASITPNPPPAQTAWTVGRRVVCNPVHAHA